MTMTREEIVKAIENKRNGSYGMVEYVSNLDRSLTANARKSGYSVEKYGLTNMRSGIRYEAMIKDEYKGDYDPDKEQIYEYATQNKIARHKASGKLYFEYYAEQNIGNKNEYIIKKNGSIVKDVDIHNLLVPSFFNSKTTIAKTKKPFRRVHIENIISIK